MGITSLKNKITKRIKQEGFKTDFQEIGTFIKKRRKDLNLTQDVISSGICSVSYLSKIENNQIAPNEFFIREIMTKLDVEEDFLNKNLEDKTYLDKVIKYFFYVDKINMDSMYQEICDIEDNLVFNICKFGYIVFTHKRVNSNYVVSLENLVPNMNNLELKAYLLFSSLYFMSHDDYKTALEILLLGMNIKASNELLSGLLNEYTFYVKQRLLKKNCSLNNFDEAKRIYAKYLNSVRSMSLSLNKIKFLVYENPKEAMELLDNVKVSLLNRFNLDYYHYIKAKVFFELDLLNESVISLSLIKEGSYLYTSKMVLLYEICLIDENEDMLIEIKSILSDFSLNKGDIKDKVYYHLLIQKDIDDKKEYLRDIAIPFSIKISDYYSLKRYIDLIIDICIENSRYKEAMQYYKKYQKELSRVEKILYK